MRLIDIVNSPWAILPEKLDEIIGIYMTHLRGEKIDISGLEARLGAPLKGRNKGYGVRDGVAVLKVDGVLAKRITLLEQISGGTSLEILQDDIRAALADPTAHALVLLIDSPGGAAMGLQEVGELIYNARRGPKEVVAITDGMMASAAYWIGAAADQVFISSDTTMVGSIGVLYRHVDLSGAHEKEGVKVTPLYAGRYKTLASPDAPLTDEARVEVQRKVDKVYSVFVNTVARNRGVDAANVLTRMADGRVFLGREAIDAGLVDGVSDLDRIIEDLNAGRMPRRKWKQG